MTGSLLSRWALPFSNDQRSLPCNTILGGEFMTVSYISWFGGNSDRLRKKRQSTRWNTRMLQTLLQIEILKALNVDLSLDLVVWDGVRWLRTRTELGFPNRWSFVGGWKIRWKIHELWSNLLSRKGEKKKRWSSCWEKKRATNGDCLGSLECR